MNVLMASTVGWLQIAIAVFGVALVFAVLVWWLRRQNRMFPKGFDRTGWNPDPGKARRFETRFTYFTSRGGG